MHRFSDLAKFLGRPFAGRLFPVVAVAAALAALSLVTRLVLLSRVDSVLPPGIVPLFAIFSLGLAYDLVAALYFTLPLTLWLALVPNRLAAMRLHQALLVIAFAGIAYLFTVIGIAEWLFWEEFGARFNFIAVDYLLYTHEVIGNIRESYPIGWILSVLAIPAALLTALVARPLAKRAAAPLQWRSRLATATVHAVLVLAAFRLVSSDYKDFSANDAANELAGNGIYEFFAANYRNELSFERYYVTLPPADALHLAKRVTDGPGTWLDTPSDGFERYVPGAGAGHRFNIVLVSVESMGAEFLGAYGDPRGLTPNLDRLSRESLWFSNVFATGNRTVRGLEALALALPPTPGQSIVRRPKNEHLFSLGSVLEDYDYDTLFAYGGYGYFDNMNAFFDRNDYRVVDRTGIPKEKIAFENIWGVADEHLFDFVIGEIDRHQAGAKGQPFFVHVMTTSNHRPYTYPAGRIDIPSGSGREGAVKYADWAIGHFLEEARKRPWFPDTIFVITADHGANARGTIEIPVEKYRIPLFVHGPRHIAPQRVDRLMSQIDIAPTLIGILGLPHYSKFFGRDILHSPPGGDRAFVANYQTLGYLKNGKLVVLQPQRKVRVFRTTAEGRPTAPDEDPDLVREAIALYQSASHVFRSGRYRDEEQLPPDRRPGSGEDPEQVEHRPAALLRVGH
ncbi:MAG: sulfatase-like hydrolase/transferase [Betaproteobacteria bacterium]|nr:sulfatase-like hydrolase/transferase [Betaproteobacteria bacterium]